MLHCDEVFDHCLCTCHTHTCTGTIIIDSNNDDTSEVNIIVAYTLISIACVLSLIFCCACIYQCIIGTRYNDIFNGIVGGFTGWTTIVISILQNKEIDESSVKCAIIILRFITFLLSATSSFALSDFFGFNDNQLNASIAIVSSMISLFLSCNISGMNHYLTEIDTDESEYTIEDMLLFSIMFASVSDALFDIIQALAIWFDESFTTNIVTFVLLLVGTGAGVSDEIFDFFTQLVALTMRSLNEATYHYRKIALLVILLYHIFVFLQIGIAIFLAVFYRTLWLTIVSITIQILFAFVVCAMSKIFFNDVFGWCD